MALGSGEREMKDLFFTILHYGPFYLSSFAALFSGPKKFIAGRLQKNTETEWINALVFLAISIVLVTLLQIWIIDPTRRDLWTDLGKSEILNVFITACGVVVVRFSWWLVGGKADAKSFFITYAYAAAGLLIILGVFQVLGAGIFKWQDPELFPKVIAAMNTMSQLPPDWYEHSSFHIFVLIMVAGLVSALIWFVLVWGVFRHLTGLSKFRSSGAFTISFLLTIPLFALAYFINYALVVTN
jgi:hypothetical protein